MRRLLVCLLLPACVIDIDDVDDTPPIPESLPTEGQTYVVDGIDMPSSAAEATELGLDLDGDDVVDNALGQYLAAVTGALGVDVDERVARSVEAGELLHLLLFAADETGEHLDTGRMFLGADADGDPTNNFTGDAELAILDGAPLADAAFGTVTASSVDLGRGVLTIENVIFAPVRLPLTGARIVGTFDALGNFSGTIAGGIPGPSVELLRERIAIAVANEANEMCDPDAIPCCPGGSRGETYLEVFDENLDCVLEAAEVEDHFILKTFTSPDMDLDGDGIDESLSIAMGVTAVPATFEIP